jgi:hypothetical protein
MDEGTGTTVYDKSKNSETHDLTINSGIEWGTTPDLQVKCPEEGCTET